MSKTVQYYDERQEAFNSSQQQVKPNKSQVNEMLILILNKVEASNEVLSEMKLGLSQFSHIMLSHVASIKCLEACLSALSAQVHQINKRQWSNMHGYRHQN